LILTFRNIYSKIKIQNLFFFVVSTILGLWGIILFSLGKFFLSPELIATSIFYLLCSTLSIPAGYHRYFSHRSYESSAGLKYFYLFFGASHFMNSAKKWAQDHRQHHQFTDDPKRDPYPISRGFWYAHIGWAILKDPLTSMQIQYTDLVEDPAIRFQDKWIVPISVLSGLILPWIIGWIGGSPWFGIMVLGWSRIFIYHHCVFFINSMAHSKSSHHPSAVNRLWISLLVLGEGYHLNHHLNPTDYRSGRTTWTYDPTKWFIFCLSKMGLAWNLKRSIK
jgi:stearoyl-CoA desaturase (delta-9 desaturase)